MKSIAEYWEWCNNCTDMCAVDLFTITHFVAGMLFFSMGFSFEQTNILHVIYEAANHYPSTESLEQACESIRKVFTFIPHCKLNPVYPLNSVVDQVFVALGWLLARWMGIPRFWLPDIVRLGVILVMPYVLILSMEWVRLNVLGYSSERCVDTREKAESA